MPRKHLKQIAAALLALIVACWASAQTTTTNTTNPYERMAKSFGWSTNFSRGREIVNKLASLSPDELEKLDITAYRGERVAFGGVGAPPGGSNDLVTENGFYLRVLNRSGKDLRPKSVWWEVMVCGKILQVLPKNKIIMIEVDEKDWKITETG
jgi:hypothetical protein